MSILGSIGLGDHKIVQQQLDHILEDDLGRYVGRYYSIAVKCGGSVMIFNDLKITGYNPMWVRWKKEAGRECKVDVTTVKEFLEYWLKLPITDVKEDDKIG